MQERRVKFDRTVNMYLNQEPCLHYLGIAKFKALFLWVKLLKEHCTITVIS